jgi:hypothetical protein
LPAAFDFVRVGLPQFQTGDLVRSHQGAPFLASSVRKPAPERVEGWGRHTPMFTFELHFFLVSGYRRGMIELEEALREAMSPDEILMRFRKLFGREMTAKERDLFFLSPEPPKQNRS